MPSTSLSTQYGLYSKAANACVPLKPQTAKPCTVNPKYEALTCSYCYKALSPPCWFGTSWFELGCRLCDGQPVLAQGQERMLHEAPLNCPYTNTRAVTQCAESLPHAASCHLQAHADLTSKPLSTANRSGILTAGGTCDLIRAVFACKTTMSLHQIFVDTCVSGQEEKMKNELQQEQVRYQQDGPESTTGPLHASREI